MTTRTDVEVTYVTSPRVAEVKAPSTEIIMQDLVDTLRKKEDTFEGMVFKKLINASGKEDLGGGVSVGITVAMQNLLLAFQGRTTPAQVGTVTSVPAAPVPSVQVFADSSATFIANGVQRGSFVVNFTDQSIADVVSVDSETQLTTKVLVEGIGNTYDVADEYKVWNIIQVNAIGGNLTAVDEFQAAISSILPTAFTQVVLTASSSATLQELPQIQELHGQVGRSIYVNTESLVNGNGYQQTPYNNWSDAIDDAEASNITSLVVLADATVDRQIKNFTVLGVGSPLIDLNGQNVDKSEFKSCLLSGAMLGTVKATDCALTSVTGMDGQYDSCSLGGTCEIAVAGNVVMNSSPHSSIAGLSRPTFSMNALSTGAKFSLRGYNGGLTLTNCDHVDDEVTLEFSAGKCTLDATCTAGTISVRGIAQFTDSSTGSAVDETALIAPQDIQISKALLEADHFFDKTGGLLHYYYRNTTTDIIPAKTVSGEQVTNNVTLTE